MAPGTTFNQFLAARKSKSDRQGDFVRLALRDKDFPAIHSLQQLTAYVRGSTTLSEWSEPATLVWIEYARAAAKADVKAES